jgi:hypothetical protein
MAQRSEVAKGVKAGGGEIVTATELAAHLDCARSFLDKLEASGVIHREPGGGFNLVASRVAYIRHLRRERTTTQKGEAEAAFLKAKRIALEVRTAQKLNQLVPAQVAFEVIDEYVADVTIALQNIPARAAGGDRVLRRRIETAVFEARKEISGRMAEKARQAMPEIASVDAEKAPDAD